MLNTNYLCVSGVLSLIREMKPTSILDLGCGFGKWGLLFRENLDLIHGRYHKGDWKIKIDALDVCDELITPVHKHVYDNIHVGTISDVLPQMGHYDLIFTSNCIEYGDRLRGEQLLYSIERHSNKQIICIPLDGDWSNNDFVSYNKLGNHTGVFYK